MDDELEQRGEDEGEEQRGAEERAGARPYSEDPSEWPSPHEIGDSLRQYMVENGPYPRSDESKRCFSKAYCFRVLSNGEKVERDWLLYSKSTNRVIVLHVSFLVKLELLTHALWWGIITGSIFQKHCSTMKPVIIT